MSQLCISSSKPAWGHPVQQKQNQFAGVLKTSTVSHSLPISFGNTLNGDQFTKSSVHFSGNKRPPKPSPAAKVARVVGAVGLVAAAAAGSFVGVDKVLEETSGVSNGGGTSISAPQIATPTSEETPTAPGEATTSPSAKPSEKPKEGSLEEARKLEQAFVDKTKVTYQKKFLDNNWGTKLSRPRATKQRAILVAHDTEVSFAKTMGLLGAGKKSEAGSASAHFVIDRDGTIYPLVPTYETSFSVGISSFKGQHDIKNGEPKANDMSLNVEMVMEHSMKDGDLTEAQIKSLAWIAVKSGIDPERFTTHRDVANDKAADIPANDDPHTDPRGFSYSKSNKLGKIFWDAYDSYAATMKGKGKLFTHYELGMKS